MTNPTPQTLRSLAGLSPTAPSLANSAVIVIDAQREYEASGALPLPDVRRAGEQIAAVLTEARRLGSPVVHVSHLGSPGGLFDPATGGKFSDFAEPFGTEVVVTKTLPNAFAGTDLQAQLELIEDKPLIIAGFMTHMCVSATARAALDLGINTTVLADATATRALPAPSADGSTIPACALQASSLAALADRFSVVCTVDELGVTHP